MLSARDLTLRRGSAPLFENANFTLFRGQKAGLTGANGSGKSSLFAAVLGVLTADRGDIERPAELKIAHVEQEVAASDRAAIEFVLDGDVELRRIMAAIDAAERSDAALELAELYASLQAVDGYRARARAAAVMHGLGFQTADHGKAVAEFSGGWRVRLAMARALGSRTDLLLLDEPTNHLDLDAIVWLEEWLKAYPGTLLMISHDREFLDAIIDRVLHIENRTIRAYSGNYSQFEQKRAEELAQQHVLQARQQRRVADITSFVNRFRASATKSRQAQSRLKMLARMERIVPAHVDSPFEFEFGVPLKIPRPLITLENAACGHGERRIVSGINVSIGPLDRIALLGPNGAGKSTLAKMLAADDGSVPLAGRRIPAADLAIGYFAQQQMEQLNPDCDAFWHVRHAGGPDHSRGDEQTVRDHLGRFGFEGDRAFTPVQRFSGGEKARLTLALIVARRPNLLLLDEPTNHLDIDMRHALTVALQGFTGGLVVVSHDRHLIKTIADTLWLVADGKLTVFDGDLDDYQGWLKQRAARTPRKAPAKTSAQSSMLDQLRREFVQIERRLANIAAERTLLEAQLQKPAVHGKLHDKSIRLIRDTELLEARWMEVGIALEAAEGRSSDPG